MSVDRNKVERFTNALEKMLMKMQEVDNFCVELTKDISKRDFSIIVYVGKSNEVIMRDIAEYLNTPMSTTTGIVDKLVDKGYITRFHSQEDRRIIKVKLSKFGKDSFDLLETSLFNMSNTMLSDLAPQERTSLISLLEKVTQNLENHLSTTIRKPS